MDKPDTSLRSRAASGLRWTAGAHGGKHVLQLLTTLVLVTLLEPADFGLASMGMVFVGFVGLFHDLGTSAAIVQRKDVSETLLSTIFWVNVGCGVTGMVLLIAAAPLAGMIFADDRVAPLLMLMSLSFVIAGPGIVHGALLRRDLLFDVLARVELAGVAIGAAVGITSAASGYGAWALAHQLLATAGVQTVGFWSAYAWRPQLVFSRRALRGVAGFSLNLVGFNALNYFVRRLDYLLIGRFLGATDLGVYTLAYRLMLYPVHNIAGVIGRVMLPVYARMQDDDARFRAAYTKIVAAVATVTLPLMIGLMITGQPFVRAILGPEWAPVGTLLLILAPVGMIQSLLTSVGMIYQAKGRTGLLLTWGLVAAAVVAPALLLGVRYGITGVAVAYATASILLAYPSAAIPFRLIGLTLRRFIGPLRRTMICSACMGVVVLAARLALPDHLAPSAVLSVLLVLGVVTYVVSSLLINRELTREMFRLATARPA
ncbi:MAG: MOP flippase family protein [Planctomycetota bacterium]